MNKINTNHLTSTYSLRAWNPFFKPKGERVTDAIKEMGINPNDFINFYADLGDAQLEFVEKIINERIKQDDFDNLSKVQAAYLGYNALFSFMKQLSVERGVEVVEKK